MIGAVHQVVDGHLVGGAGEGLFIEYAAPFVSEVDLYLVDFAEFYLLTFLIFG